MIQEKRLNDLSEKTKDTYVLYNNHFNAKAPANATVLQKLLLTPLLRQ
jgi:uncharacterized protein YecE (DUF72 family)